MAYIGIGSNQGDARGNCLQAARLLADNRLEVRLSSLYVTEPQEVVTQGWYVNAVAEVKSPLSAEDIFSLLRQIEEGMGREREGAIRYGPRVIDLDLLFYDHMVIDTKELILPHPRLHKRRFVLVPLCEVAPHFEHPVLKKKVCDLLEEIPESGQRVFRIGGGN